MANNTDKSEKMTEILIVEDSPTQSVHLQHLLEQNNFKVEACQNGQKALMWLKGHSPSLIISDIMMPEMNGFELCEKVKDNPDIADIPVILLTSLTDPDEIIEGLSCGADYFITKPYNNEYLLSSIHKIILEKLNRAPQDELNDIEINYKGSKKKIRTGHEKIIKLLLNIYQGAIHQNNELINTRDEMSSLNERLEELVEERTKDLKKSEEKIRAFNAELEQKIEERTAELDAANKAKSEFLANMSHEIRTPMNAILGYAELLGSMLEEKTHRDYLESIKSSGRSLLTLINDILDLSKIEAGRLELQLEYVNSKSFFAEFERIFSLKVSQKGLKFILDISSGTPDGLYVDEVRLRQIILNLIGNAVKFTDSGSITLKVFTTNPQISVYSNDKVEEYIDLVIEVSDTGIGISEEVQKQIFNPFVQGQGQSVKKYGGTGLGLAITQRLVTLMNGTIVLKSVINKGSTFIINIPEVFYLRDFEKREQEFHIDPAKVIFEKATILIADDVEHNRRYLIDSLSKTDIKLVEADNGRTALTLAGKIKPDLIITDIRMPIMDGFELLDNLKADAGLKDIPVIAYSASVMKAQSDRIKKSEFAGLLIKPVQITELYIELMNNLRYKVLDTNDQDKISLESNKLQEIEDLSGLIRSLETTLKDIWMTFEIRQPIEDVLEFGNKLARLGKEHNSSFVSNYGEELINAADNFNIEGILNQLKRYPVLIDMLKN